MSRPPAPRSSGRTLTSRLRRPLLAAMAALLVAGSLAPLAAPAAAGPAAPELAAPADGAVLDALPLFAWTLPDAPDGATVRLEVAAGGGFDAPVVAVETTETSHQQVQELDRTLAYAWRVGLLAEGGGTVWSATWGFAFAPPAEPTVEPTPEPTLPTTEPPPPGTEVPTDSPTESPTEAATATPPATEAPPSVEPTASAAPEGSPATEAPSPEGEEVVAEAAAPSATRATTRTRAATPLPTAAPKPAARRATIPPSRLSGALPASEGLPLAGASRSNGSTTSAFVVDRDLGTIWTSPATTPRDASVTVKLDRSRSIGKIRWVWGLRYHGDRVRVEVSRDQETWTRVATVGNAPTGVWQELEVSVRAKYVRFRFENPERDRWLGGLAEVEVHAGPRVVDPATPTATPTPPPAPPQPDGIIANASFERGASAWRVEAGAGVVEGVARGGERAIRLLPEGGYAGQWVELEPGAVYELSAWGRLGRAYDVGSVGVLFYGADGVRLKSLEPRMLSFTTTDYARATLRFAVPARVERVVVTVYKVLGGARLYVDDLAIREVAGAVPPDPARTTCQSLMLPGYFDPATGLWDRATSSGPAVGIAVFNPESGPDDSRQPAYAEAVAQARAAGQRPFAYVYTAYGARPIAAVLRDIRTYKDWYGLVDIFLDNGQTTYEYVEYYRTIMAEIHANGGVAVVNYGWWPHPAYMEFTDIANIFEDTAAVYEGNYSRPSWILDYPAERFSHIVYSTPADRVDEVIALSRQRNAAYVWISDDDGPVLYKGLPSYWAEVNAAVRDGC